MTHDEQAAELATDIERRLRLYFPDVPITGAGQVGEAGAAAVLGLHPDSLRRLRTAGEGPAFHRLGGRILYSLIDIASWVNVQRQEAAEAVHSRAKAGARV